MMCSTLVAVPYDRVLIYFYAAFRWFEQRAGSRPGSRDDASCVPCLVGSS